MTSHFTTIVRQHRCTLYKAASLCVVVIALAGYNLWAGQAAAASAEQRAQAIADAQSSGSGPYATDGVFTGSAEGYGGQVSMQVTIENGWITAVDIIDASQEDEAWLEMAQVLPDRIIEAQTPNIDVVSGATFTSLGILNGVTEALTESMSGGA